MGYCRKEPGVGVGNDGPLMMALEPRILLDGAALATAADAINKTIDKTATQADPVIADPVADPSISPSIDTVIAALGALNAPATTSTQVVFVDAAVADYQTLIDGIGAGVDVVILSTGGDGVQQMADYLNGRSNIDSIQIFSHGDVGQVSLGNTVVDATNLDTYQTAFATIGASLTDTGDILLYGCSVAADGTGQAFIDSIAQLTSADVAASDDLTGAAALGGDWILESSTGTIEATNAVSTAALSNYAYDLAFPAQISGTSNIQPNSVAVDSSGNVYTAGEFSGTADFDPGAGTSNLTSAGNNDIFVTKYDSSGAFVWAKAMGGAGADAAYGITLDTSGNVHLTGQFNGTSDFDPGAGVSNLTSSGGNTNPFVVKLNSSGVFQWAKAFTGGTGGQNNNSEDIAVDSSGNVYTTGYFQGTVDFDPGVGTVNIASAGNNDLFISKLDSSGAYVWTKTISDNPSNVNAYDLAIDSSNNLYLAGLFNGTVDFDPSGSTTNLTSAGNNDAFIAKFDSSGNFTWAKAMGGTGADAAFDITVDTSGNVYTTGVFKLTADFDPNGTANLTSAGNFDAFVAKYDSSGAYVWASAISGASDIQGKGIAVDSLGNVYTAGELNGTGDFDPGVGTINLTSAGGADMFVTKLDSSGAYVWAKAFGAAGNDYINHDLFIDTLDNVYAPTYFSNTVDFDPGAGTTNLASAGGYDGAALVLDSSGTMLTTTISITSSTYDSNTGILLVTGTNFLSNAGSANDIDASMFTLTGDGGDTYTLTNSSDVEITSASAFTISLSATDKAALVSILDKDGASSNTGTTYNLAAAEDWMAGADSSANVVDLTSNAITVSNAYVAPTSSSTSTESTTTTVSTTDGSTLGSTSLFSGNSGLLGGGNLLGSDGASTLVGGSGSDTLIGSGGDGESGLFGNSGGLFGDDGRANAPGESESSASSITGIVGNQGRGVGEGNAGGFFNGGLSITGEKGRNKSGVGENGKINVGDAGDMGGADGFGDMGGPGHGEGDIQVANIRGDRGHRGDRGERGDRGDRGEHGDKGDKGDRGDKGDKGDRGDKGDKSKGGENSTEQAAGAGNSDTNENTTSGTLGNQGNDKNVGNAGGALGGGNVNVTSAGDVDVGSVGDMGGATGFGDMGGPGSDSGSDAGSGGGGETQVAEVSNVSAPTQPTPQVAKISNVTISAPTVAQTVAPASEASIAQVAPQVAETGDVSATEQAALQVAETTGETAGEQATSQIAEAGGETGAEQTSQQVAPQTIQTGGKIATSQASSQGSKSDTGGAQATDTGSTSNGAGGESSPGASGESASTITGKQGPDSQAQGAGDGNGGGIPGGGGGVNLGSVNIGSVGNLGGATGFGNMGGPGSNVGSSFGGTQVANITDATNTVSAPTQPAPQAAETSNVTISVPTTVQTAVPTAETGTTSASTQAAPQTTAQAAPQTTVPTGETSTEQTAPQLAETDGGPGTPGELAKDGLPRGSRGPGPGGPGGGDTSAEGGGGSDGSEAAGVEGSGEGGATSAADSAAKSFGNDEGQSASRGAVLNIPVTEQGSTMTFTVPPDAFVGGGDTAGEGLVLGTVIVEYKAALNGGGPLPGWLDFNANTGTFSGKPPENQIQTLKIDVTSVDKQGKETTINLELSFGSDGTKALIRQGADTGNIGNDQGALLDDGSDVMAQAENSGHPGLSAQMAQSGIKGFHAERMAFLDVLEKWSRAA